MLGPTVALLDGALPQDHQALLSRTDLVPPGPPDGPVDSPGARHAAAIAGAILAHAPSARLVNLAIFGARLTTSADLVARAMALSGPAEIVHCSFGLGRPDPELEAAVAALVAAGRHVVAASPARGGPVWPAGFAGVIAVQGDARCGPAEWSHLALPHARFGACPQALDGSGIAGSSIAAAHLTGHLAARIGTGEDPVEGLARDARYIGRERRGAQAG